MQPTGLFLLIVGLCSLAVIGAAGGFVGLKAWRLFKRGLEVTGRAAPLAADLAARSEKLGSMGEDVARQAAQIQAHVTRLQASVRRLQILIEAWRGAVAPYQKVRDYLGR